MSARRRFAILAPCGVRPAGVMALTMALTAVQAQSPNGGQPLMSTAPKIGETTLGSVTAQHTISGGPAEVAAAVSPEPPSAAAAPTATSGVAIEIAPTASVAAPAPIPAPTAQAVWQGNPIPVALKVDAERRIDFPESIADIDIPQTVARQSRVVLSPTGQLHWLAREPFAPVRVLATAVGGTLYQLDVSAQAEGAAPERLTLHDPVLEATADAKANAPTDQARLEAAAGALIPDFLQPGAPGAKGQGRADYAALARFALAHYTGPARLIPKLDATPVAVRPFDVRDWVRLPVAGLTIRPLQQWKAGNLHVTALGVYNGGSMAIPFEPKALRGRLLFAAALHPTLEPAGSGHNGTVWAVVTAQPFNQAVIPHATPLVLNQ